MTNKEINAIMRAIDDRLMFIKSFGDAEDYYILTSARHSFEEMLGDE